MNMKVSGSNHSTLRSGDGSTHGTTRSHSSPRGIQHADGFRKTGEFNKFSPGTTSGSHNTQRPTTGPSPLSDPSAADSWRSTVTAQNNRPTVAATATAMTTPGSAVNRALSAVQPPIPMTPVTVVAKPGMIPQTQIGPVTADQVNQLRNNGYNLDCGNALHAGSQNYGMRDGNTLWRMNVTPAGTDPSGKPLYNVGFYGEQLPPDAPKGQGALRILPGVVLRAGFDQPVGEGSAPTSSGRLFQWASQWFPPA